MANVCPSFDRRRSSGLIELFGSRPLGCVGLFASQPVTDQLTKRACEANMVFFLPSKMFKVLSLFGVMIPCLGLGCLFERKV